MGKGPKLGLSFLNSIQICRANDPSTLVKTSLSHSHISKTYDISLPTFPDPPSSPNHLSTNLHQPKFPTQKPYSTIKTQDKHIFNEGAPTQKKETTSAFWACNDDSLSSPVPTLNQSEEKSSVRTRRFKRYGSKDWKDSSSVDKEEPEKPHRQVNESFVVLKRSADPYQDFKKSMLEMIVERRIFEPRDLEQLLMSFLSLNSRMHHKAILKAFSEIWKEVFSPPLS
ncbi:transcription repressor OFP8-like [Salvia miltiorrhiza]|uniref:transcription repressor OFP8-like n=1 Tax=Salvia miltiorrhiza TaxID=226208 RepID=UPI0025AD2BB7|nr:transcription repressor OFP8-like [Salvia miltiorrhiza]